MKEEKSEASSTIQFQLRNLNQDLTCGFVTGIGLAGLFNPFDRALTLYLQARLNNHSQSFFSRHFFSDPWHGLGQSVLSRTFSSGTYYIVQSQLNMMLFQGDNSASALYPWQANLAVGLGAGSMTAIISNGLNVVRTRTWKSGNYTFMSTVINMWQRGGVSIFMRGTFATVKRDAVSGIFYEMLRSKNDASPIKFAQNISAAALASVLSSPFNYARIVQYSAAPDVPAQGTAKILSTLWQKSKSQHGLAQLNCLRKDLLIGPGTLRVSLSTALGQLFFDQTRNFIASFNEHDISPTEQVATDGQPQRRICP